MRIATKVGFVPNVFRAYARRPEHFRAFMAYHDVLMKAPGGLNRAEREAIVVAVSSENRCQYCMTAHGAALRILGKDPMLAEQIANNWRTADLSPRWRAMLEFASRVNEPGFAATDAEIDAMRDARLLRRRRLGHRRNRGIFRFFQSHGRPDGHASERRILFHGPLTRERHALRATATERSGLRPRCLR